MLSIKKIRILLFTYFLISLLSCNEKVGANDVVEDEIIQQSQNSISGKILCGYQGWFNAEGDGADLGWKHYSKDGIFEPGTCSIDFWPYMDEYTEQSQFKTSFQHTDGSSAFVFSSADPQVVDTHFNWMKDYRIDGVFVQRFVVSTGNEIRNRNLFQVFDNCYMASQKHERVISVMYDLSGSKSDFIVSQTKKDWMQLVDRYGLNDPKKSNHLTHDGKAIVAIWGVGFKDRDYTLEEIGELIRFFKEDPKYGGCSVLLGVPTGWRSLERDCLNDPMIHELIKMADIVHPWTPGRYRTPEEADEHRIKYTVPDRAWCETNNLTYMPVVFPGFSWHNLKGPDAPVNQIPRLDGDFLWRQFYNAISSDVETIYVAMFDEMDEGTCIFKVSDNPPIGESPFLTYEGLPNDYYLKITGEATRMLKKEIPLTATKPIFPN
ncbi:MAG: glycoside hydrolase family 71/99-like protein [Bacteroidota bacterium]